MAYIVRVSTYSLAPHHVGEPLETVYESKHRSPAAASRRLAELINGKTERARQVRKAVYGRGARYTINERSLKLFRMDNNL